MVHRRPRTEPKPNQVHFHLTKAEYVRFKRAASVMGVTLSHFAAIAIANQCFKIIGK